MRIALKRQAPKEHPDTKGQTKRDQIQNPYQNEVPSFEEWKKIRLNKASKR